MNSKLKGLTKKEYFAIEEFKNSLIERFPKKMKKIILFGSKSAKSRRDFSSSSDIDILVVVSKNGKDVRREVVDLTHEPNLHSEVLLSPITVEEKFFKNWSPLLGHIEKEGIIIWTNERVKKNM